MVHSKRHGGILHFQTGLCGMEIAILLLLTVPLAAALPITSTQRSDSVTSDSTALRSVEESPQEAKKVHHATLLKIIPFLPEDHHLIRDALKHRIAMRLRLRRAPRRGCQLGTCQLHNLANTLYHISKTNGKDESTKANDPQGYGR